MKTSVLQMNFAALILRLGFGSMMLLGHGLSKFKMLLSGEVQFPEIFGLSPMISLILAVLGEFLASILIILGFKTRWASIPVIGTMAVAVFVVHWKDAIFAMNAQGGGSKEFALIYMFGFIAIFFLGSGNFSLDKVIKR